MFIVRKTVSLQGFHTSLQDTGDLGEYDHEP